MQTTTESTTPPPQPAKEQSWGQKLLSLLGILMFAGILVALSIYTVPNLISDWQVRSTAIPFADGRVTEGSCRSKLFVHVCTATLAVQSKSGRFTRDVNYVFFDLHVGDYSVAVMADPARPEMLTTDMALNTLWSRTLTLLVGAGLLLAAVLSAVFNVIRRMRQRPA
ncbi:hypothetical protein ACVFYP_03430 [Roseomonas sp. F4]